VYVCLFTIGLQCGILLKFGNLWTDTELLPAKNFDLNDARISQSFEYRLLAAVLC